MKSHRYWIVYFLLAVVVCLLIAVHFATRDTRPDIEKIQGEWEVNSEKYSAASTSPNEELVPRYVFRDNKMTMEMGGEVVAAYTFTLDPTQSPKEIDMKMTPTKSTGWMMRGAMLLLSPNKGIYRLNGDELVIYDAVDQGPRPKDFASEEGRGFNMVYYRRRK